MQLHHAKNIIIAFGDSVKASLLQSYAAQAEYNYIQVPNDVDLPAILGHVKSSLQSGKYGVIVDGLTPCLSVIANFQSTFPSLIVIPAYFSREKETASNENIEEIRQNYRVLGLWKHIQLTDDFSKNLRALRRSMIQKIVFLYGAPLVGKTEVAKHLSRATGTTYVDYNNLRHHVHADKDHIEFVNILVKHCMGLHRSLVVDGFIQTKQELAILEEYLPPFKVIHLGQSKDEIQVRISKLKDSKSRSATSKYLQQFIEQEAAFLPLLSKKQFYLPVEGAESTKIASHLVLQKIWSPVIYLALDPTKPAEKTFIKDFAQLWNNAIHIDLAHILDNRTFPGHGAIDKIKIMQSIIFSQNANIILTGFPDTLQDIKHFEASIAPIHAYVMLADSTTPKLVPTDHPTTYFLGRQKLITLQRDNLNPKYLLSLLKPTPLYYLVSGPQCVGKTSLARNISKDFGFTHIEYETYLPTIKQKLISAEDGDELPLGKIINHFKSLINAPSAPSVVIDGLPFEGADFEKWVDQVGAPTIINLRAENSSLIRRFRKKNESDLNAEQTEEQVQRTEASLQKNNTWLKSLEVVFEKNPGLQIFQVDANSPLISCENLLSSILKPRVLLVSEHHQNTDIFKSLAVAFGLAFINLKKVQSLRSIVPIVRGLGKNFRDIVLVNYNPGSGLISDDLYWIEKNIGIVRYVALGHEEKKHTDVPKIVMQRPPEPPKKKKMIVDQNGQEKQVDDEEEPPAEEDDGQPKKPKINLYDYEWSMTGIAHNLSQWFLAYKKPVSQISSDKLDNEALGKQFGELLSMLNQDRTINIYHLIR